MGHRKYVLIHLAEPYSKQITAGREDYIYTSHLWVIQNLTMFNGVFIIYSGEGGFHSKSYVSALTIF